MSLPDRHNQQHLSAQHLCRESACDFNKEALSLWRWQLENNDELNAYSSLCDKNHVSCWKQIPPIPTTVFKHPNLFPFCFPREESRHRFLTSGTTSEIHGQMHWRTLETYECALWQGWLDAKLPTHLQPVFLCPEPEPDSESSLHWMFLTLSRKFEQPAKWIVSKDGHCLTEQLSHLCKKGKPLFLLGTALSYLHWMKHSPSPLPAGSFLLETGGYKGLRKKYSRQELYPQLHSFFEIPFVNIINEYGMTELSSQCYARGMSSCHRTPPWMRALVINPHTQQECERGEMGYLALYDLANVDSVLGLFTQDFAIAFNDREFELIGRDPEASARGCSRSSDQLMSPDL